LEDTGFKAEGMAPPHRPSVELMLESFCCHKILEGKSCRGGFALSTKPNFGRRATHTYTLCGLQAHSEIPLTGVPTSVNKADNVDVVIQVATGRPPVAEGGGRLVFQHSAECSRVRVRDVAEFEITGGRQIRIWPAAGATRKDIEIFLFGPVWAILCHQRGMLPLHASAVVTGKGITAFAGHSGAGKSTTAALLNSLGYELIADDILPVSFNQDSIPGAWPYLRRLKLHRDPIIQLAFTPTEIVSETLDKERYFVCPKRTGDDKWRRLERLYLLENAVADSHDTIEHITGADAVRALVDQTYHFDFIRSTRQLGHHLAFCARLASKVLVYRLRWSALRHDRKKLGCLICAHLEAA
jgi:hypothetical protein